MLCYFWYHYVGVCISRFRRFNAELSRVWCSVHCTIKSGHLQPNVFGQNTFSTAA